MIQQTLYKKPKFEKDSAIEKSYKCLKGAFFSILFLIICALILTSGITFNYERGGFLIYPTMTIVTLFIPIISFIGTIYGVRAALQKEQLSNKEVWVILGNFTFLFSFILLFWFIGRINFG